MIEADLAKAVPGFTLDIAFRNHAGITALFGPSGSGKSMTLALIAGLMKPDRGRLSVGDAPLLDTQAGIDVATHKRRIGLVFQDAQLFPHLTVRQNLKFGRWFAPKGERAIDFDGVVETLGIGALLGRRPAGLSGGETQRVAIGRALLACPRLLLFDEPLASLDRPRRLEILPLIERLRDTFAIPILYVSHELTEVVRLASHVVLLDKGRVRAQGDPAAVFGPGLASDEPRFGRVSVIDVKVGTEDASYGLTALTHPAGTLWLAGAAGPKGRKVRAIVKATDVALAPAAAAGQLSIRSALATTIVSIEPDGPFAVVTLALEGDGSLTALVTRKSVDELGLAPGQGVQALVKTVALDEGAVPAR